MPVEAIIIPLFIMLPLIAFIIVIVVLTIAGLNQHLTSNIDGHTVEVKLGYGYAQLIIDGIIVDELKSIRIYTAKLQGVVNNATIVVNIGTGFCKYRITTFVNGCKDDALCN